MRNDSSPVTAKSFLAGAFIFLCAMTIGLVHPSGTGVARAQETSQPPFSLSIVPGIGGITMAKSNPREFYVVITNVSGQAQSIWQQRNSWGYKAISFQLTTSDGKTFLLSKKDQQFTINFPSTFVIGPGEHQVYPVKLDEQWRTSPQIPQSPEMSVALKAIYEVAPTAEAKAQNVWIGRVESRRYDFSLRQW
jgi:hypothetical protein